MKFIEIRNMSKSYLKQDVLNGINLVLPSKGMVYLMGESGGGKSTFINCLIGIETMDKGEIYFQGKKIKNFTTFRNKYVGIVYQNINLISFLNVEENINIKKRGKLSQGDTFKIDEYKKTRINFLSGGEAQRVAIKRAINSNCKILLCDEPTGSLDKENAERVMQTLKELSKNILVLIVSHNQRLANKYADYLFEIKEGKIQQIHFIEKNNQVFSEKLKHLSFKHLISMGINTLLKNKMKAIISIIALSISFSILLFSYNASNNINLQIKNNQQNYLDYNMLRVVKEKINKVDNTSLTLVKEERFDLDDIKQLGYLTELNSYMYDLSPVFSFYPSINCPAGSENYLSNIEFVPYSTNMESRFQSKIIGRFPKNENEVVINNKCRDYLTTSRFNITIDKTIDLKLSNKDIVSDKYFIDVDFVIVGQVEEFEMLETPKIYYPYNFLKKISKEIKLENLSNYYNVPVTLYDRITTIRGEEDAYASNYLYVEVDDINKVEDIYTRINSIIKDGERYKATNSSIEKIQSFKTIFESIEVVLNIFVVITVIISFLLLCLSLYSYILDYKKDIGIMLGMGILKSDISLMFVIQSLLIGLISLILAFILYFLISKSIDGYIYNLINISILTNKIQYQTFIYIMLIYVSICILCSLITSMHLSKLNIASVLREE